MRLSKLNRIAVGAALALALSTFALTPAAAEAAPTITWDAPATITDGASYAYGQVPAAPTCSAVDELAAAVQCDVAGYGTAVGTYTLTATAAGTTSPTTISYTVTSWTIKGFFRPVKMTKVNKVKGGSTVPLKFKVYVGGDKAKSKTVVSSVTSQLVSCTDFSALAEPVALPSTGKGRTLRYYDGAFHQNWKTAKAAKVTTTVTKEVKHGKKTVTVTKKVRTTVAACYVVAVTTADGSSISAQFQLR
ncbi:MAG: PxKF domain-containing protein [Propionibacteriales bacterium]|nr:PxKF domain-containing protein [Propionibacteriales bacterium]